MFWGVLLQNKVIPEDQEEERTGGILISKSLCEHPPESQGIGLGRSWPSRVCRAQGLGSGHQHWEKEDVKSKEAHPLHAMHMAMWGGTSGSDSAAPTRTEKLKKSLQIQVKGNALSCSNNVGGKRLPHGDSGRGSACVWNLQLIIVRMTQNEMFAQYTLSVNRTISTS